MDGANRSRVNGNGLNSGTGLPSAASIGGSAALARCPCSLWSPGGASQLVREAVAVACSLNGDPSSWPASSVASGPHEQECTVAGLRSCAAMLSGRDQGPALAQPCRTQVKCTSCNLCCAKHVQLLRTLGHKTVSYIPPALLSAWRRGAHRVKPAARSSQVLPAYVLGEFLPWPPTTSSRHLPRYPGRYVDRRRSTSGKLVT